MSFYFWIFFLSRERIPSHINHYMRIVRYSKHSFSPYPVPVFIRKHSGLINRIFSKCSDLITYSHWIKMRSWAYWCFFPQNQALVLRKQTNKNTTTETLAGSAGLLWHLIFHQKHIVNEKNNMFSAFSKSFAPDLLDSFKKQWYDLPEKSLTIDPNAGFGYFTCESNPQAEPVSILGASNHIVIVCAVDRDASEWVDSLDFLRRGRK